MIFKRRKLIRTKLVYPLMRYDLSAPNKETFKLDYSDGTTEYETVVCGSVLYNKYTCKKLMNG